MIASPFQRQNLFKAHTEKLVWKLSTGSSLQQYTLKLKKNLLARKRNKVTYSEKLF